MSCLELIALPAHLGAEVVPNPESGHEAEAVLCQPQDSITGLPGLGAVPQMIKLCQLRPQLHCRSQLLSGHPVWQLSLLLLHLKDI